MAVHILGKMAVVCACSGVGVKVRPVSFNVLLCVLICLGKDIGGYFWSKQLLHWLFACVGPGACHALQPIHFLPISTSNCLPTSSHSPSSNGPSPSSPCGPTPSKSLLSTSHPSPSKEDPSPSSPFPDCGASSTSTSISAPSNAPPSTTPSHSSSNFYCMHIKYHFWMVHGDRLYQSSIRHRCSRYQGCP